MIRTKSLLIVALMTGFTFDLVALQTQPEALPAPEIGETENASTATRNVQDQAPLEDLPPVNDGSLPSLSSDQNRIQVRKPAINSAEVIEFSGDTPTKATAETEGITFDSNNLVEHSTSSTSNFSVAPSNEMLVLSNSMATGRLRLVVPRHAKVYLNNRYIHQIGEYRVYDVRGTQQVRIEHGNRRAHADWYPGYPHRILRWGHNELTTIEIEDKTNDSKSDDALEEITQELRSINQSISGLSGKIDTKLDKVVDSIDGLGKTIRERNLNAAGPSTSKSYGDALKKLIAIQKKLADALASQPAIEARKGETKKTADVARAKYVGAAQKAETAQKKFEDLKREADELQAQALKLKNDALHLKSEAKTNRALIKPAEDAFKVAADQQKLADGKYKLAANAKRDADDEQQHASNLQSVWNTLQSEANIAASEAFTLKTRISQLRKDSAKLENDAKYLEGIQHGANSKKVNLLNRLAEARDSLIAATKRYDAAREAHKNVRENLAFANQQITTLTNVLASLQAELQNRRNKLDELKIQLEKLKTERHNKVIAKAHRLAIIKSDELIKEVNVSINEEQKSESDLVAKIASVTNSMEDSKRLKAKLDEQVKTAVANEQSARVEFEAAALSERRAANDLKRSN